MLNRRSISRSGQIAAFGSSSCMRYRHENSANVIKRSLPSQSNQTSSYSHLKIINNKSNNNFNWRRLDGKCHAAYTFYLPFSVNKNWYGYSNWQICESFLWLLIDYLISYRDNCLPTNVIRKRILFFCSVVVGVVGGGIARHPKLVRLSSNRVSSSIDYDGCIERTKDTKRRRIAEEFCLSMGICMEIRRTNDNWTGRHPIVIWRKYNLIGFLFSLPSRAMTRKKKHVKERKFNIHACDRYRVVRSAAPVSVFVRVAKHRHLIKLN